MVVGTRRGTKTVGKLPRTARARPTPASGASMMLDRNGRRVLYERQAKIAWLGGILSRKDRMLLDQLGNDLGLSIDEIIRIEARVLSGADGPPTSQGLS